MKKLFTFLLFIAIAANLFGQNPAKKYITMEHFTNSRCSVCASKNPGYYTIINTPANSKNIHHLSIHPSTPYADCVFYQHNTAENQALANYFSVVGTPVVYLNGVLSSGSTLTTQAKIDAAAALTSPITIKVAETTLGTGEIEAKVTIKTVDAANTSGNFRLLVAIAEKKINQTTPNGESVHHDVFRKMLTATSGNPITLPAVGESLEFTYKFPVDAKWKASEVFVTAYVRDATTKAVLQSGTKFDVDISSTTQVTDNQTLSLFPNPATDQVFLSFENVIIESVDVFNAAGQVIVAETEGLGTSKVALKTTNLTNGYYFTKVKTRSGTSFAKFVKH